jgi:hypothetical protein
MKSRHGVSRGGFFVLSIHSSELPSNDANGFDHI